MRKYIYIGLAFLLAACQEDEIVSYDQDMDSVQFNFASDQMELSFDFAMQYKYENWENYFFGDSLRRDTVSLPVSLMGHKSDVDRTYKLKTVLIEGQDSTKQATIEFSSSYVFRANQVKDTAKIVLIRPEKRGDYTVGITFDVEDADANFAMGVEERAVYRVNITDRYVKPNDWDQCVDYTGEFTEEKYAFMVTILHKEWMPINPYSPYDWGKQNQTLRAALDAFNAKHPNNPKDFTFPVFTKPTWWDMVSFALGDFSEAKREFMDMVFPGGYMMWDPWEKYNPILRAALETYNQEHPDAPLEFTFPKL